MQEVSPEILEGEREMEQLREQLKATFKREAWLYGQRSAVWGDVADIQRKLAELEESA